jgi:Ni/Fe-hydrogenase subunit HybB-like protein
VRFFSAGALALVAVAAGAMVVAALRFGSGLGAVTHLDDRFPWGIWIGFKASGVALAAGGFVTAVLVHVLHRPRYSGLVRGAILTALLGYLFVALLLVFDLGRYWAIWHPLVMWQGNSVLFEVGMCVIAYLLVLGFEFLPVVAARMRWLAGAGRLAERVMFLLILAGAVLSCLHQSSLGALMLIAPSKVHGLWFTPVLPLLFLLSAIAVGLPMVILAALLSSWSLRRAPAMEVLARLARLAPIPLAAYLSGKLSDLVIRDALLYLADGSAHSLAWMAEVGLGVALPLVLLLSRRVRGSAVGLGAACALAAGGVLLNRMNVFVVAYAPAYVETWYTPALGEVVVALGLAALFVLAWRFVVMRFPVRGERVGGEGVPAAVGSEGEGERPAE